VQFLVDLCQHSQLTLGPFLRGFYFTGVRPIVINEVAPVAAAPPSQAGYGSPAGAT
jgi:type VI secretion system protein ImpL